MRESSKNMLVGSIRIRLEKNTQGGRSCEGVTDIRFFSGLVIFFDDNFFAPHWNHSFDSPWTLPSISPNFVGDNGWEGDSIVGDPPDPELQVNFANTQKDTHSDSHPDPNPEEGWLGPAGPSPPPPGYPSGGRSRPNRHD